MRLLVSILFSVGIAIFFAMTAQASDLVGGQASALTGSRLNMESQKILKNLCDNQSLFSTPTKSSCVSSVQEIQVSQEVFDYCTHKPKNKFFVESTLDCLKNASGADYPLQYLKVCESIHYKYEAGIVKSSAEVCLRYLSTTRSSFNSAAFELCAKAGKNHFKHVKPCLNWIRDRDIDVQKFERECFKKDRSEEPMKCIERLADSAPVLMDCGNSNRNSSAIQFNSSGTQ